MLLCTSWAARLPLLNCRPPSPSLAPPPPIPSPSFLPRKLWVLGSLPTDTARQLYVLVHDGDALGVDGA